MASQGGRATIGRMTTTTFIIVNGVLAVALVYSLVHLLVQSIHADRHHRVRQAAEVMTLPRRDRDRIAA